MTGPLYKRERPGITPEPLQCRDREAGQKTHNPTQVEKSISRARSTAGVSLRLQNHCFEPQKQGDFYGRAFFRFSTRLTRVLRLLQFAAQLVAASFRNRHAGLLSLR